VIDQTVLGNAWQAGVGRTGAPDGGQGWHPVDKPAVSVNVRCGSSIQALIFGAQAIKAGDVDAVLVGGTESTNQSVRARQGALGYRMGKGELLDLMHQDGFLCLSRAA